MEIIATFSIQLYISIYSTLGFNFSEAYTMFCADCSSILFEVINTHSLISCTILYSLCWWVSVLVFLCGGTITNVQLWISMSDEVFVPLICIYIWLDCTACAIVHATFSNDTPSDIFIFFYTTTCYHSEDLLYVKVGHDHLYTYSFTILYVYRDMQRMTQ